MQNPDNFDASSQGNESTVSLPLEPLPNDPITVTPEDIESASTHVLDYQPLLYTQHASATTQAPNRIQQTGARDTELAIITDLPWDSLELACGSPRNIWNLEGLDGLVYTPEALDMPSVPSPFDNWPQEWQLPTVDPHMRGIEHFGQVEESSIWSGESAYSTCSAEPASPLSSTTSRSTWDRRSRYSASSRGSRTGSHLRYSSSDPLKRPINPIKQSKASVSDTSDLSSCDKCGRAFKLKKDMERHKQSVHISRPSWFCPVKGCKYNQQGFSRKDKAFQHVKTHRDDFDANLEPIPNAEESSAQSPATSRSARSSPSISIAQPRNLHAFATTSTWSDISGTVDPSMTIQDLPDIPESRQTDIKPHSCSVPGCDTAFVYPFDLRRHMKAKHTNLQTGDGYICAAVGCSSAGKIWSRVDSLRSHIWRRHGEKDADSLIRPSSRSKHESGTKFPFTVTTPDTFSQRSIADCSAASKIAHKASQSEMKLDAEPQ